MKRKRTLFDFINILIMLFVMAVMVLPLLHIASLSFSKTIYIVQNKVTFFPRGFNIDAYKLILMDDKIPRAYLNTIIYTVAGTAVNLLLTSISAYPLARKSFFGRRFFMIMIVITMFFNGGMIPNYIVVRQLGMIDTIWAMIIPNAIWTFNLLILKSFYESQSPSLYESAVIDGASEFRIMFRIFIPLSKAAIASIALFYLIGHWNDYFLSMIYLNDSKKMPLQVLLRNMVILDTVKDISLERYAKMTPEAMKNAAIFITMLPILIVYPFVQKHFIKGVMLGSVKE